MTTKVVPNAPNNDGDVKWPNPPPNKANPHPEDSQALHPTDS